MLTDEGVIHAESLRVNDNSLRFGRIEFLLPELDYINKAAYWDYQRSRVYVRSNRRLRRLARLQHGPRKPARKLRPNKISASHPGHPHARNVKLGRSTSTENSVRRYTTSSSVQPVSKDGSLNIITQDSFVGIARPLFCRIRRIGHEASTA